MDHPQVRAIRTRVGQQGLIGLGIAVLIGFSVALLRLLVGSEPATQGPAMWLAGAVVACLPLAWFARRHASAIVGVCIGLFGSVAALNGGLIYTVGPIYLGSLFLTIAESRRLGLMFLGALSTTGLLMHLVGVADADFQVLVRWPILVLAAAVLCWFIGDVFHRISRILGERDDALAAVTDSQAELARKQASQDLVFGMISHEMRAPIARLSLLGSRQGHQVEQTRSRAVRRLVNVLERMRQIIDPDYHPRSSRQPTVLSALVREVLTDASEMADLVNIDATTRIDPIYDFPLILDADRLRTILTNGLENAIRHSGASHVRLSVTGDEKRIHLAIEDDGCGFDADSLSTLHEPWARGPEAKGTDGLGLGLHIINQAASELGGSMVLAASDELGGAAIHVEVEGETQIERRAPTRRQDLSGLTVALVDDDQILGELTADSLRELGASVEYYASAEAADLGIENTPPDLIIVDHFMPRVSGAEWIEAAKKRGVSAPIVGLTGALLLSGEHPLVTAGAVDVLEKPIHMPSLLRLISEQGIG